MEIGLVRGSFLGLEVGFYVANVCGKIWCRFLGMGLQDDFRTFRIAKADLGLFEYVAA